MITKCILTIARLQIDIDTLYWLQSHLTSQTEQRSRLVIVRGSFKDRINHIHNLNLAPTLIITNTNSEPKNSLTQNWPMTSDVTVTGGK